MNKREILFRAWDSVNEIMRHPNDDVYDNPDEFYGDDIHIMLSLISGLNNQTGFYNSSEDYSHISVMEYTGLKDYSNNKIFEGDIIVIGNNNEFLDLFFIVEFINYSWTAKCIINGLSHSFHTIQENKWNVKIIGNIFENKYLIQ